MPPLPPQLTGQNQSSIGSPQMEGQMMASNDQNQEDSQPIIAYFDKEELEELDGMQGGMVIDPETNLRDYRTLDKVLRIPEIKDQITSQLSQFTQKFARGGEVEPGKPIDPELENLRMKGRNGDKDLAIITPYLLETLSEWGGREPDINPETGLPEFGFFKELIRIISTIAGPGTAFIGSKLTGQSTGAALKNAGIGLGLSLAAAGGMNPLSMIGMGGSGGAQGVSGALGGLGGGLSNLFTPSAGGGVMSPFSKVGMGSVGQMMPGGASSSPGALQAAGQTGRGFLSNLLSGPLPLIGSGLLMAKGHKEEQKGLKDYQRALEDQEKRQRGENEAMREKFGFNAKLNPLEPYRRRQIQPNITEEQYMRGIQPHYFENYAQGGAIRGVGKGQEDNIPTNLKEGSYIIDASTVSDIGDGSTDAGMRELDRYFSKASSSKPLKRAGGGIIKAMVSDGEYEVPPERVTSIGGGSNQKGAKILKKFVKQVRAKKRTSGSKLPPKSKPIGGYLSNIHRVGV